MSFFFVVLMTSLPQIHAIVSPATQPSLKSMATHSDLQHNQASPSPAPTISSSTCSNGLEDGNYIFRSYSEQNWSFCGVSGTGYHELPFRISGCECHVGVYRGACVEGITFSPLAPTSLPPSIMPSVGQSPTLAMPPSVIPNLSSPTIPHHLHCSADEYSISSTDTCLLIILSDQYGDGWSSGDGSSENAWFGYSFSSSNGDSSAVTYHSLNCSCPRMIGCLSPSSFAFAAEDQTIDLAIYSNEDSAVAFSWEIMYLVQVIQNGRLLDSHHGGYRTHMEFSYTHSSETLSLSSKTDGAPGNGDAVDMSKCQELPVVGLVSDLSLEGWSIVDSNSNKQETIASRNPNCVHTHFQTSFVNLPPGASPSSVPHLPVAESKLSVQEYKDSPWAHQPTVPASSRHLAGELGEVGNVTTLAGLARSTGSANGVGTIALFNHPLGVSISPDGVYALVADFNNHLIRHVIVSTASVTTLAGVAGSFGSTNGVGTIAIFKNPRGVSISPDGVYALVGDTSNHLIRHITISTASVTNLVGRAGFVGSANGVGTIARFNGPIEVSISPDGVYALVGDQYNHLIRHITISTASVTTLAGVAGSIGSTNGVGTIALFNRPTGVSISPDGVYALVADYGNHLIRHITISTASVTTLTGVNESFGSTNGVGSIAQFYFPFGVSISPADGVYALVADRYNYLIRHVVISTATTSPSSAPSASPSSAPSAPPSSAPSASPSSAPSASPSSAPSAPPSSAPSASPSPVPSIPLIIRFSFGIKIGDKRILSPGKAILVDYLQDPRRGWTLHPLSVI
jgi:DNA-binding beta-propeller fold protein YncE